jgi:hypothetical protein
MIADIRRHWVKGRVEKKRRETTFPPTKEWNKVDDYLLTRQQQQLFVPFLLFLVMTVGLFKKTKRIKMGLFPL